MCFHILTRFRNGPPCGSVPAKGSFLYNFQFFFFSFWLKFSSRLFPKNECEYPSRAGPGRTGFFSESGPVLGEATRVTWRPFNPFVPRMRKSRWNCSFRRAILSQDGQRLDEKYPAQVSSQCHGQRQRQRLRQEQGQGIVLNNRYRFQTCFHVEWLSKMASLLILLLAH